MHFEFSINLIVAVIIFALLVLLFVKEIRSKTKVDLFLNSVIAFVGIVSPLVSFFTNKFAFREFYDLIFLLCIVIDIAYIIFYIIKYFKQKKAILKEFESTEDDD